MKKLKAGFLLIAAFGLLVTYLVGALFLAGVIAQYISTDPVLQQFFLVLGYFGAIIGLFFSLVSHD